MFVATVLTVYGIETILCRKAGRSIMTTVATVLTVYGIETLPERLSNHLSHGWKLQQYLPFTVLKPFYLLTTFSR